MFNIVYSRKLVKFARLLAQRPICDTSECSFNASVSLYVAVSRTNTYHREDKMTSKWR